MFSKWCGGRKPAPRVNRRVCAGLLLLQVLSLGGLCTSTAANTTNTGPNAVPQKTVRMALLLPLRSASLGQSAEAVRAGVQAAFENDKDGVTLNLLETDGSVEQVLTTYAAASNDYDIIIGPLSRTEASAVAQRSRVLKPTIALASRDAMEGVPRLPPKLLAMGLSVEDEARQVAHWAAQGKAGGTAFVISTNAPWQQRAAKAFAAQWQLLGRKSQLIELGLFENYLNGSSVAALRKRVRSEIPAMMFLALDAQQAAQLRTALGGETAMYGSSQLNAGVRTALHSPMPLDSGTTETRVALGGVLLVDLPWQLEADHPAVMVYPQLLGQSDPPPSADQARLYALGIDAYRVARELSLHGSRFALDGVSGKLQVRFEPGAAHFERLAQPAVYRDGMVVPLVNP